MSFIETYDMLVIGNGETGKYLAWTVRQMLGFTAFGAEASEQASAE